MMNQLGSEGEALAHRRVRNPVVPDLGRDVRLVALIGLMLTHFVA